MSPEADGWAELGHPATVGAAIEAADVGRAPTLKAMLADLPGDKKKGLSNQSPNARLHRLDRGERLDD